MIRTFAVACIAFVIGIGAFGQARQAKPKFDVVEIKLNKSKSVDINFTLTPAGLFTIRNMAVASLVRRAWGRLPGPVLQAASLRKDPMEGAPAWFETDHVDIAGRVPPGTSDETAQLMLQAALEERFQMKARTEERIVPVFTLVVSKGGPKMQASKSSGEPVCKRVGVQGKQTGGSHVECTNMQMSDLADKLGTELARAYIDRPVVDRTELSGTYDFKLDWVSAVNLDKVGGVTIFGSIEKLGLKLERTELPATTIVIESATRLE